MKKVLAGVMAVAMLASATSCGIGKKDDKITLNIWAFTDEVPNIVQKYLDTHDLNNKYKLNITNIPTTDGAYQPALDQALIAGGKDAPDLYCAEAAFVKKYTQGDFEQYAAPYSDLKLSGDVDKLIADAELAQYAVDIGTNSSGKVVGLGYQATGGAFIYRRSIAKDVFGTDDPEVIQTKLGNDWDTFYKAADELKAKGYAIVSGDGDIWHAIENSSDTGWIKDGKLHIDPKREEFFDYSMLLKEKGYHNDTQDWQDAWFADMKGEGDTPAFGFFGPAWLINYTMADNSGGKKAGEGTYGDWAVCKSPIGFFWGGTWLLANKDSKQKDIIGDIIEWVTLDTTDTGLQYLWANGTFNPKKPTKDAVASKVVMEKSNGEVEFLGGQNMFDVFIPANDYADGTQLTQYDEKINSFWRDQVRQYTAGNKSKEQAITDFKQQVKDNLDLDAE